MIKRLIWLCLVWLYVGMPVCAGPFGKMKDFVQNHKRFTAIVAADIAGTIVQYEGTKYCRQGDIERCNGGYGFRKTRGLDYVGVVVDAIGLPVSEACWKDQLAWKFCYVFAYAGPTYQVVIGTHDFASYKAERNAVVASKFFKMPKL